MSPESPARPNRALLLKLGIVAVAGLVVLALVWRGLDLRAALAAFLAALREAGPAVFFTAMAILPACGAPLLTFVLPAVAAFGPQLGTVNVVLLSLAAITVNLCLAYAVARRGLRPLVQGLVTRLGYRLPAVDSGDAVDLLVLLRVMPGVPFVVQNFLAGLAEIPFGKYVGVSVLLAWPINTAFLLFGDALLHGQGRAALLTLCVIVALTALLHLVRKHYERRKKPAEDAAA